MFSHLPHRQGLFRWPPDILGILRLSAVVLAAAGPGCAPVPGNYPQPDPCRSHEWIGEVCGAEVHTEEFTIRIGERLPVEDAIETMAWWHARKTKDMTADQRTRYLADAARREHPALTRINSDKDHNYFKGQIVLSTDCTFRVQEGAFIGVFEVDGAMVEEADSGVFFSRRGDGAREYVFTRDGPSTIDATLLNRDLGKPNYIKLAFRTDGNIVGLRLDPTRFEWAPAKESVTAPGPGSQP